MGRKKEKEDVVSLETNESRSTDPVEHVQMVQAAEQEGTGTRPVYLLLGTTVNSGETVILWSEPTIGRARKVTDRLFGGYSRVYENLHWVRARRVNP